MPDYRMRRAPKGKLCVIRVSKYGSDDIIGNCQTPEDAEQLIKMRQDAYYLSNPDKFYIFDEIGRRVKRPSQKNFWNSLQNMFSGYSGSSV